MDYVATMNSLVQTPEFYNALVDNCTTSIRRHVSRVLPNPPRVDWRLFANGYGDQMLYERGNIDTTGPWRHGADGRQRGAHKVDRHQAAEHVPQRPDLAARHAVDHLQPCAPRH